MSSEFLLYGSTGFLGEAIARLAVSKRIPLIIAARNADKLKAQAIDLNLEYRVFKLEDTKAMDSAVGMVIAVLNCAGPYMHTFKPLVDSCLRLGRHYLDLTGEIPVYDAISALDAQAKSKGAMLLPGVGFDVVPTDCLAVHPKQKLPSARRLTLAFQSEGPAGLPPGTQRTMIELIPYGNRVRRNGRLEIPKRSLKTRKVDFGKGPVKATRLTWGDVFMAHYSTSIPNIETYAVLPEAIRRQIAIFGFLRPLFKLVAVRNLLKHGVKPGPTLEQCAKTSTHVWGEVEDDQGRKAASQLDGPEAGVVWTARSALAAVKKVLAGNASPGFQTPALAFGADFVLDSDGVTRRDIN
jgi:short subunit dehydrogenase-like uncharacterized protein